MLPSKEWESQFPAGMRWSPRAAPWTMRSVSHRGAEGLPVEGRALRRPRRYSWHQPRCSGAAPYLGADEDQDPRQLHPGGTLLRVVTHTPRPPLSPAREAALRLLPSAGSQQTFGDVNVPSEKVRVPGSYFAAAAWPVPGTKGVPSL